MPTDALFTNRNFHSRHCEDYKEICLANKQHAQQTGALPTELTRQWSNLGSGSHGQLFCLWKTLWPPPPPTFRQAPPPLLFRYITENSFFMGTSNENIWWTEKFGRFFIYVFRQSENTPGKKKATNRLSSPSKNIMFPWRTTFRRNCRIWCECQCQCPTF